jgi:hypothetical protein
MQISGKLHFYTFIIWKMRGSTKMKSLITGLKVQNDDFDTHADED